MDIKMWTLKATISRWIESADFFFSTSHILSNEAHEPVTGGGEGERGADEEVEEEEEDKEVAGEEAKIKGEEGLAIGASLEERFGLVLSCSDDEELRGKGRMSS
jgi:hypothetical protein